MGCSLTLSTDRVEGTVLYSRISNPGGESTADLELQRTNNTILVGGRLQGQLTDFANTRADHDQRPPVEYPEATSWRAIRSRAD